MLLRALCAISLCIFACSSKDSGLVVYGEETYETVVIGKQKWLKRNLNYIPIDTSAAMNFKCYEDNSDNCDKYGLLYDWATAMALPAICNEKNCASMINKKHRGICPSGWHIPTSADWDELLRYADSTSKHLKAKDGWGDYEGKSGNGEDTYGFSALPGGTSYPDGNFYSLGNYGYWWSANEINKDNASRRSISYDNDNIGYYSYGKNLLLSVRCLKDN